MPPRREPRQAGGLRQALPRGRDRRTNAPPLSLEPWLRARVAELGLQSDEDLTLLSAADFLAPELPYESKSAVEDDYPLLVSSGDAKYRADYDLTRREVTLYRLGGSRNEPPSLGYLPKFPGLRILVDGPRGVTVLRARG